MSRYVAALRGLWTKINLRTLCFLLGIGVLALMVFAAGPHELCEAALKVSWALPMALLVWAVVYIVNAHAFGVIIKRNVLAMPLSRYSIFRYTVAGYAINYITPMGLLGGEPYRVMELKPYLGVERATGSVLLYAMMHICSHFIFWIAACGVVVFTLESLSTSLSVALLAIVCASIGGILLFFRVYRKGMILVLANKIKDWPLIGKRIGHKIESSKERLQMIDDNIGSLLLEHRSAFFTSLGLELLARFVGCWEIWLFMAALGCQATFADAFIIVALSSLFANLLFFSPLQLGTREGGIFISLQLLTAHFSGGGMGERELLALALAISLATRLREFLWIGIGLLLMKLGRRPTSV